MEQVDKLVFGERLRTLRKARYLTIEQASELLDISVGYYGLVERGQRMLSLTKLISVCNLYAVTLDFLILGVSEDEDDRQKSATQSNLSESETSFITVVSSLASRLNQDEYKFITNFMAGLINLLEVRATVNQGH